MTSSANIGTVDRVLRIVVAIGLAAWGYSGLSSPWSFVAYAGAAVLLFTAVVRFCLAYRILGISTCKIAREHGSAE